MILYIFGKLMTRINHLKRLVQSFLNIIYGKVSQLLQNYRKSGVGQIWYIFSNFYKLRHLIINSITSILYIFWKLMKWKIYMKRLIKIFINIIYVKVSQIWQNWRKFGVGQIWYIFFWILTNMRQITTLPKMQTPQTICF